MSFKQLESFDSGSNYNFADKMEGPKFQRSLFDLSHLVTTTIPNAGLVFPIGEPIMTVPGDDFDISCDFLLRVMPQVVPLYSRQRVYIYAFWSRFTDLWCDWDVFARKGYTGNVIKKLPTLSDIGLTQSNSDTVTSDSLADYLGLPIGSTIGSFSNICHSLYLMQYLRIWRDYFINKNYYINDRFVLPDDDSRFRLGSDGKIQSATDLGFDFNFDLLTNSGYTAPVEGTAGSFGMFYHEYPKDYFTSALPWPQRGDTPSLFTDMLSLAGNAILDTRFVYTPAGLLTYPDYDKNLPYNAWFDNNRFGAPDFMGQYNPDVHTTQGNGVQRVNLFTNHYAMDNRFYLTGDVVSNAGSTFGYTNGGFVAKGALNYDAVSGNLGITLNQLRELAIAQTELEKMARTDGSYAEFGLTFFGEKSKSAMDFRPVYIGGSYKNIVFNEVLQTSGSQVGTTDVSSHSPLGAYAGHGIAGQQQGYLGHLHADDYGSIMLLACIMPDVYYSQGLSRDWTLSLQSEIFLPERAKLGMVPVLNRELYLGSDSDVNADLWAYQNPFDNMRYRTNTIHGKIADPAQKSFFPYTQSRKFDELPNWSREFATADDVRKDFLFAPVEDAYSAQFSLNIRAVRPLPYKPIPANILN